MQLTARILYNRLNISESNSLCPTSALSAIFVCTRSRPAGEQQMSQQLKQAGHRQWSATPLFCLGASLLAYGRLAWRRLACGQLAYEPCRLRANSLVRHLACVSSRLCVISLVRQLACGSFRLWSSRLRVISLMSQLAYGHLACHFWQMSTRYPLIMRRRRPFPPR